jgi:predicted metal-binding membrane protein
MNWQSIAALGIVACTAVLMVRGAFRRSTHKHSCCDGCAKAHAVNPAHRAR